MTRDMPAAADPEAASLRRRMLTAARPLLETRGLAPPRHIHSDWPEVQAAGHRDAFERILGRMAEAGLGDHVFVQAAPLDEGRYPGLSFAGCFKTAHPRRALNADESLRRGLGRVLDGRWNRYCDLYYARHGIETGREIGVKIASLVPRVLRLGTVYAFDDCASVLCHDSYVGLLTNDPIRVVWHAGATLRPDRAFETSLAQAMSGIVAEMGIPIDAEFVADAEGRVFVSQMRPVSAAHCAQFAALGTQDWERAARQDARTVIPGMQGALTAVAVDLRRRAPADADAEHTAPLFVVHRAPARDGTSALDFLAWANRQRPHGFGLLIDHGPFRYNDHLDYIMFEDPDASFVAAATELPEDLDGRSVTVKVRGFDTELRI